MMDPIGQPQAKSAEQALLEERVASPAVAQPAKDWGQMSAVDALAAETEDNLNSLAQTLHITTGENVDQAAKDAALSKQSGLPYQTVKRNSASVAQQERIKKLQGLIRTSPAFAEWMRNPQKAAMSHQDAESLVDLDHKTRTMDEIARDILVTGYKGLAGVTQAAFGIGDILTGGRFGKAQADDLGIDPTAAMEWADQFYSPETKRAQQAVSEAQGFMRTIKAALENPSTIATSIGESLPGMVVGGRIGAGVLKYFPKVAPVIAGGIGEGTIQAGQSAEQARAGSDNGLLSIQQALAAVASGGIDAGISILGGTVAKRLGLEDIDVLMTGKKLSPGSRKMIGLKFLEGAMSEGILEELPQSMQEQMWQNWSEGKPLLEGVAQAGVLGMFAGMAMGGGANLVSGIADRGTRGNKALLDAATSVEQSRLLTNSPETLVEYAQRVGDQHGLSTVYLQADRAVEVALKNGMTQEQIPGWLAQYGVTAEQLQTELLSGGKLALNYGETIKGLAADPVIQALKGEILLKPADVSKSGMKGAAENEAEHLAHLDALYQAEQANKIDQTDIEGWQDAILENPELKGKVTSGHLMPLIARANALSTLTGTPAIDHLNRMLTPAGLQVTKYSEFAKTHNGMVMQGGSVNIETPEFKAWFEGSEVVDEAGNPLVVHHGTSANFDTFQVGAEGYNSNFAGSWKTKRFGMFFSPSKDVAEEFATQGGREGHTMPVYLYASSMLDMRKGLGEGFENNIEAAGLNPRFYLNHWGSGFLFDADEGGEKFVQFLKDQGYDGAILDGDNGIEYVVFDPAQIKSVNNQGTFSLTDPNIYHQESIVDKFAQAVEAQAKVLYQVHTVNAWEKSVEKWMADNNVPKNKQKEIRANLLQAKALASTLEEVKDLFPHNTMWNTRNEKGKLPSPVRDNSDEVLYIKSLDLSATCVKRLEYGANLIELYRVLGRTPTADDAMLMVVRMHEEGKQAPCVYCYVESPRRAFAEEAARFAGILAGDQPLNKPAKPEEQEKYKRDKAMVKSAKAAGFKLSDFDVTPFLADQVKSPHAEQFKEFYAWIRGKAQASTNQNAVKTYVDYSGQLLELAGKANAKTDHIPFKDWINQRAGMRIFSTSDFQIEHVYDLLQAITDMNAVGMKAHAYTKQSSFVRIFGATGIKIQMSVFATEKNGEFAPDTHMGMDWAEAQQLREKYGNAGTVMVTTSDAMTKWAMAQPWVDYVLPFHASGMPKAFFNDALHWQNFTSTQNEKSLTGDPIRKTIMQEFAGVKGKSVEQLTKAYLALCKERGVKPVFAQYQFLDDGKTVNPNFSKLRRDYARADTPFVVPDPSKVDMVAMKELLDEYIANGGRVVQADAPFVAKVAEEIKSGVKGREALAGSDLATRGFLTQSAWHGSPHKFDEFSTSKIGTGEGAQAYGYGLYFAGNKEIAEYYQKNLAPPPILKNWSFGSVSLVRNEEYTDYSPRDHSDQQMAKALLSEDLLIHEGEIVELFKNEGLEAARAAMQKIAEERLESAIEEDPKIAPYLKVFKKDIQTRLKFDVEISKGNLYKVELAPEEDEYLLWEEPIDKQPEKVREALRKAGATEYVDELEKAYFSQLSPAALTQAKKLIATPLIRTASGVAPSSYQREWKKLEKLAPDVDHDAIHDIRDWYESKSGGDLYVSLQAGMAGQAWASEANPRILSDQESAKAASEKLHAMGIRGIKYFDGSSRAKGEGNYNYVIFSDDDVKIEEMYQRQKNTDPLAALSFTSSGENIVSLFEKANRSSFLHETGHIFLNDLKYVAENLGVQTEEWNRVKSWLGVGEDGVITTPMHEKFADHFEVYLKTGQAPTMELRGAFRKFKKWLTQIYDIARGKSGRDLSDVRINPEIKDLFDHLLATEQEIKADREQAALIAMLDDKLLNESHFTPEQIAEYKQIVAQAEDSAIEKRDNHKLVGREDRLKTWKAQATDEAKKLPVFAFQQKMKEQISRASIVEKFGEEDIPDSSPMYGADGIDINIAIAENGKEFGYESAGAFVGDLRSTSTQAQWIQKRMAQLEAQYDNQQDTQDAIRTSSLKRQLEIESQFLAKQAEQENRAQEKKQKDYEQRWKDAEAKLEEAIREGQQEAELQKLRDQIAVLKAEKAAGAKAFREAKPVPAFALDIWARGIIRGRTISQIQNLSKLLVESKQHRQEALKATRQGKWDEALQANEKARMTEELIRASYQAQKQWKGIENRWKKIAKWTNDNKNVKVGEAFRDQINRVLTQYGIAQREFSPDARDIHSFVESLAENELESAATAIADWIGAQAGKYSKMPLEQLQDLDDALKFLYGKGREEVEGLKASWGQKITEIADEIISAQKDSKNMPDLASDATRIGKIVQGVQKKYRKFFAQTGILRFIARRIDGYTNIGGSGTMGPAERIVQRVINGMAKSNDKWTEISVRVEPLLRILTQNGDTVFGDLRLPPVFQRYGMSWTKERVVVACLNMGNDSNMQRLRAGYDLSESDITAIQKKLTAEEWKAAQGVWKELAALWPEIAEVHERMNFFKPKRLEIQPLTVQTADGQALNLDGGYYPASYDKSLDRDIAKWTEKDDLMASHQAMLQKPVAKSGFTKGRADEVQRPLNLSLSVLGTHFNDSIRYITLAEAIKDADRVFNNGKLADRNIQTIGRDLQDMITPALKNTLRPEKRDLGIFEKGRVGMSVFYMGYNAWTALQNVTGIFPMIRQAGVANYANGAFHLLRVGPWKAHQAMMEASGYMRLRDTNIERDMKSQLRHFNVGGMEINGTRYTFDDVKGLAFAGIRMIDSAVSLPAWWGRYNAEMEKHGDVQKATEAADAAVNSALGSGLAIDVTDIGRHPFLSLLAPFMSFAATQQEVLSTERAAWKSGKISGSELLYGHLMTWVFPAIASTFLQGLLMYGIIGAVGGGDDDKKKKDALDYATDLLSYRLMGIPFVRDVWNAGVQALERKAPITSARMPATESFKMIQQLVYRIAAIDGSEKSTKAAIWAASEIISLWSGIPASRVYDRWVKGTNDIENNEGWFGNHFVPQERKK
jgi:hypothetical protein